MACPDSPKQELDNSEIRYHFYKLWSLHTLLRLIQLIWQLIQNLAEYVPFVPVSRIVPDDLDTDGRRKSDYDIEAHHGRVSGCTHQEILPVDVMKLYTHKLEANASFKQDELDAFGTPVMEQCKHALHQVCIRSTLFPGGILDYQGVQVYNAVQATSAPSVWFTSKPFTAAVTKRPFQLTIVVLSCIFGIQTWLAFSCWKQGGYFTANLVKFESSALRKSDIPIGKFQLADFGLVQDGCKVNISNESSGYLAGSTYILNLNKQVSANGYYFQTANDSVDNDPVKWTVQASTDNGSSWHYVGASVWRLTFDGVLLFYPELAFNTPTERGLSILVDYRLKWQWCMTSVVRGIVLFIGNVLSLYYALTGREESSKSSWIVMFSVLGLCFIISAMGYNWMGLWREAAEKWIYVPECFVIPVGLAFYESKSIAFLLFFSIMGALNSILVDCIVYGQDGKCFFINSFQDIYIFIFTAAFTFSVIFCNQLVLEKAKSLVLEDKLVYDTLWNKIAHDPLAQSDLQCLHRRVQSVRRTKVCTGLRQYNYSFLTGRGKVQLQLSPFSSSHYRRLKRAACVVGLYTDLFASQEINYRVNSLDQLFAQACCLNPLLIQKTKEWALKSEGCVLTTYRKDGGPKKEYVLYSSAQSDHSMHIEWCKVKSLQRSMEKVVRTYGQDVSRLVDICRQSIVFDSVGGIVECLGLIEQDEDVKILRIKNRFGPAYNSADSAGYRDVAMNIHVITPESRALGLNTHVCELQLLLRQYAELKSNNGHRGYVRFRNLRGE